MLNKLLKLTKVIVWSKKKWAKFCLFA